MLCYAMLVINGKVTTIKIQQESLANAKVRVRQQCVYEGP